MIRQLLSSTIGVPITLLAMSLLFITEMLTISGRRVPVRLRSTIAILIVVFVALISVRFLRYS